MSLPRCFSASNLGRSLLKTIACCLIACDGPQGITKTSEADDALSDPAVGTADATGLLIIHVFESDSSERRPARLSTDFGIMMFRRADGQSCFTLAEKSNNHVREFISYEEFLEALSELPKGSVLTIYDRCTVPLFYDFYPVHQELYQKFRRECRRRGLKIGEDPKVTCTCGK